MSNRAVAVLLGGSRVRLAISVLFLGLAFAIGNLTLDPRHVNTAVGMLVMVTGLISGTVPLLDPRHSAAQRWLVLLSLSAVAVILGLLTRMAMHSMLS
jgi:hypothetical protein